MKKITILIGLLFLLSGCTSAGGFGSGDQFYYSRTTNFLFFSWDSIFYCEASGDKKVNPKLDCKKVEVKLGSSSNKGGATLQSLGEN